MNKNVFKNIRRSKAPTVVIGILSLDHYGRIKIENGNFIGCGYPAIHSVRFRVIPISRIRYDLSVTFNQLLADILDADSSSSDVELLKIFFDCSAAEREVLTKSMLFLKDLIRDYRISYANQE